MAADFTISVVAGKELADKFEQGGSAARATIRRELRSAQFALASAMKRNARSVLRQRSGDLVRSIVPGEIEESGAEITGPVGSNLEYAHIQKEGGTIAAKNVRNLTIPLAAFLTPQGIARGSARDVIAAPGDYGYDGTFFSRGVLMGRRGEDVEPLFALRPSVTLPARPYAAPAMEEIKPQFEASLSSALEALL